MEEGSSMSPLGELVGELMLNVTYGSLGGNDSSEAWGYNATTSAPLRARPPRPRHTFDDCSTGLNLARYICEVVISLPIAVLGLIGNVLAFIVLCRQKQRLTTTLLLQALAVADTFVLISIILGRSLRYVATCNDWHAYLEIFPQMLRWIYPFACWFRQLDVWLVTLLTIDRWIAVCKPLHAQRLCTLSRAYKQIAAVTIIALIVTLPRFFEMSNNDEGQIAYHWILRYKVYTFGYRMILFFLLMYLIPMVLLVVLNTMLLSTLHEADVYRAALRESRNQSTGCVSGFRSITWMVVTVVITCVLCNMLAIVSHIIWALEECFRHLRYLHTYRRYITLASNVMITINSAINFVIYCMCSKQFRQSFMRTFCSCPGKKAVSSTRASKRLSGAPFSSGSGTGLMYISLPQIGGERRKNNVRGAEEIPNTPPPQLLNKLTNGTTHRPSSDTQRPDSLRSPTGAIQVESRL